MAVIFFPVLHFISWLPYFNFNKYFMRLLLLQWCHTGGKASQFSNRSIFLLKSVFQANKKKTNSLHYWAIVLGIHRWIPRTKGQYCRWCTAKFVFSLVELGCHLMSCGFNIDGLVQERRNSSALVMELRLSYINPSIYTEIILHSVSKQRIIKYRCLSLTSTVYKPCPR